ncbi:MFS transporter [Chloroflexota bacterium]
MTIRIPAALFHRGFLYLWLGVILSVIASQMQFAALLWHIRELTPEPIYLSYVGLARFVPILAFSLLGGAVADAFNRRVVLFIAQGVVVMCALALALLTFKGQIALWHLYVLTAAQATATVFSTPARQALVPNLVPAQDLPGAFSMSSIALQTGAILGPGIGGLLIGYFGQPYAYLWSGLAYCGMLVMLVLMGDVRQESAPGGRLAVNLNAIGEGVRFIFDQPIILSSMLLDFFATFFSSARTLLPIFARDILGVGAVEYGWLAAAESVGAVGAAVVISQLSDLRSQGKILLAAVLAYGLATVTFGLAPVYAIAFLALALIGASDSVSAIIRNTIRQLQTPDRLRGRMTSVNQIFFMGGPQLGEIEAGLVAQLFGAPFAVVSGGIGCLLAVGWIARRWPQLRRYNGDEPALAGAVVD